MEVLFEIPGSEVFPNPLPKIRLTRRQRWDVRAQHYAAYKVMVQERLGGGDMPGAIRRMVGLNLANGSKPLVLAEKARMDIHIRWHGGRHGDPENVFGAIADSIFQNDKLLAGSFDWSDGGELPSLVKVSISL